MADLTRECVDEHFTRSILLHTHISDASSRLCSFRRSTPVVQWLSYSPLDPRFAGSIPAVVDAFFSERKNRDYDFLGKGSKAVGSRVVDLRHVKEPQAEIRASQQNLSDFSRSTSQATLITYDVKKCRKSQHHHHSVVVSNLGNEWIT